jgi:hypothetical protein
MIQPLIDSDILLYEVGFAAETGWLGDGYVPFDYVAELLDNRIGNICAMVEATEPPILYLTGKGNFRFDIAKRTPYKDRPNNKPWHYKNIKAYIKGKYDYVESEGMEADDLMALQQTERPNETIICSRDKDLRAVPGWQYGWELGNQPQFGPLLVDSIGHIRLSDKRDKVIGYGGLFFYAQCLTGDSVDSIPGLGGKTGPVKAMRILEGATTLEEAFKLVQEAYRASYGDRGDEELLEQGRLLHMTRNLHPDGSPVLWELPNG